MRSSDNLKKLLSAWEGCKLHAHYDAGGLLTIGIGHLLTKSELTSGKIQTSEDDNIRWQDGITEIQALEILSDDLRDAEADVNELVRVGLKQNQFDALVSFVFNVGGQAFANSTLLRMLNTAPNFDYSFVPVQLRRWNKVNGQTVKGLISRREKEISLWSGTEPA